MKYESLWKNLYVVLFCVIYSTGKTAILLSIDGIVVIFRLWFWSTLFVVFSFQHNNKLIYVYFPNKIFGLKFTKPCHLKLRELFKPFLH